MLKFISIKGQGFGSLIEPFSFKFSGLGLIIIRGKNGSGKTSSISLMSWVLYGKTLKEYPNPQTWKRLRPKNWLGTYGEVNFRNNHGKIKVVRCIGWKGEVDGSKGEDGLFLFINGKLYNKTNDKKETQIEVIKQLGMSFDLFKNSIMFGQKLKRIINEPGPIQSKVFEEAFEAQFINDAKIIAESERDILQSKITELRNEFSNLVTKHNSKKDELKSTQELIKKFKSDKQDRIALIEKEISRTVKEKKKLDITDYSKKLSLYEDKIDKRDNLIDEIDNLEKTIKREESLLSDIRLKKVIKNCSECGAKLKPSIIAEKQKYFKKSANSLKHKIAELVTKKVTLENKLKHLSVNDVEFEELKKNHYLTEQNRRLYDSLTDQNRRRKKEVGRIKKEYVDKSKLVLIKKDIDKLINSINDVSAEVTKSEKELEDIIWCIKEPLGNKGIKAYIFDSQLKMVNDRLQELSEVLPFRIEFGVDTDTKSKKFYTLVEMSGGIVDYRELSGGEQQLVNIAIAFAIHDVTAHSVNALFMDEVFESLDSDNIEIVGDLINDKAKSKEVILVTHTNFYPTGAEVLQYSKNKSGSTIIS